MLTLEGPLEVAHCVYDTVSGMMQADALKYLNPAKCIDGEGQGGEDEDDAVAVASVVAPAVNENDPVTDNGNGNASHQPKVSLQPETFENECKDVQKEVSDSAAHTMQNQKRSDQSAHDTMLDEPDMSSVGKEENQDEENRGHGLNPSRGQSQDDATYVDTQVDTQVDTAFDNQGTEMAEKETETVAKIQTKSPTVATTTTVAPAPAGPAGSVPRMQEITMTKPPMELRLDSTGQGIMVKDVQNEQQCHVTTELDVMEAMTRRSLAFDVVGLISNFDVFQKWIQHLFQIMRQPAPPGFKQPTITQLMRADRQAFVRMQELTRDKRWDQAKARWHKAPGRGARAHAQ